MRFSNYHRVIFYVVGSVLAIHIENARRDEKIERLFLKVDDVHVSC